MVVKAADVWNWDSLKETSAQLSGGADIWEGRLSWIPLKVLL